MIMETGAEKTKLMPSNPSDIKREIKANSQKLQTLSRVKIHRSALQALHNCHETTALTKLKTTWTDNVRPLIQIQIQLDALLCDVSIL